ncbi:OFA family MFS transporter [Polymorphobacter fuscus]|uniref:MFS transporter n=1 Tax=Sandarakinorhabdus fusca TaxID=1439888 RepID=A0A7C9KJE2_9SPHN|nr:OFA family MFS transporter [Polymorphobacter fuscus]KAB7645555.1 OFA family MFS transporter [Polymorphobacter fuscus]MQT17999.1 MFS transporter [Polymorphobacter fuscus]NJC08627.1 MFS family permease [Polymorphobacter fuscus]
MTEALGRASPGDLKWLDAARTVASPGFNRWLVPPCALAIHLCIGMAYGFSVFWLPLARAIGVSDPVVCTGMTLADALTTTTCDWRVGDLVWTYSIFFVVLGAAAALWGGWLERVGPRRAGVVAACCWCGGMAIGAYGVAVHQLWLIWLGTGLIGGIGLGIGYISPVSTLIKWFPDRRGLATGMAIMGFGGGAMVGSPLADLLMRHFADDSQVGVWQTMLSLAAIYFVFMMAGALGYRVPRAGWAPAGWTSPGAETGVGTGFHVHLRDAHRTPQFWLVWLVLLLNVSASIGIIGIASPMLQEIFGGRLIGADVAFTAFDTDQKAAAAAVGAGFVGLISLFNIGGRPLWSSASDRLGRKATFAIMTALGALLYGFVAPTLTGTSLGLFVVVFCALASMYGGGFATVPAYLADLFGTRYVGAIHGRLLSAWSLAGIIGPLIVSRMRDTALAAGTPRDLVYPSIYQALAALLLTAFIANLMIRPVDKRFHCAEETADTVPAPTTAVSTNQALTRSGRITIVLAICWAAVLVPIAWGIIRTLEKVAVLLD